VYGAGRLDVFDDGIAAAALLLCVGAFILYQNRHALVPHDTVPAAAG
jgi:hypothetical protein